MSVNTDYSSTNTSSASSSSSSSQSLSMTSVDFLTLLVAQLTNQDPLNPTEELDFTAQLAQLQALDEQMAMTKAMTSLRTDMQVQSGTSMIGKEVSGTDKNGNDASGLVVKVVQAADDVYVELDNGQQVPVGNIVNIIGGDDSTSIDMAASANAIGMWIEAGYDTEGKAIQGIVKNISSDNGTISLELYGGKSVTWDKVTLMRTPTDDEIWYSLPDDVREKVETAQGMIHHTVTGTNTAGETVTGIVADAQLNDSKVYLVLYNGTKIEVGDVTSNATVPTAEDVSRDLTGLWAVGYDENANQVEGLVVGGEAHDDGVRVILSNGSYIYYDSLSELATANADGTGKADTSA